MAETILMKYQRRDFYIDHRWGKKTNWLFNVFLKARQNAFYRGCNKSKTIDIVILLRESGLQYHLNIQLLKKILIVIKWKQ